MATLWKVIITLCVLYVIGTNANKARRLRRQTILNAGQQPANPNSPVSAFNAQTDARQQPLGPNPQILNAQGQQSNLGGMGLSKDSNLGQNQGGRQYVPYQGQMGYGSSGMSYSNPYGYGQYSQYGQGMGPYSQGMGQFGQGMGQYGGYGYNQYPGSGYNTGNYYNRPGYQYNNPSGGGNYYGGGSFWNAGQKQQINMFTVFLSSLFALVICFVAI